MKNPNQIKVRLEELREELRQERISYGELAELQSLAEHIEAGDVELLQAAGVAEGFVIGRKAIFTGTGIENPCSGCGKDHDPEDCHYGDNSPNLEAYEAIKRNSGNLSN